MDAAPSPPQCSADGPRSNLACEIVLFPPTKDTVKGLQSLISIGKRVIVVGITGASAACTVPFANRLAHRTVFSSPNHELECTTAIRLVYEEENNIVYMIGYSPPAASAGGTLAADHAKMLAIMFTSCHVLFYVQDETCMLSSIARHLRSLHHIKQTLAHTCRAALFEKPYVFSAYTPLKCVPLLSFVFPLPKQVEKFPSKSTAAREACKKFRVSMEAKLTTMLKPLRGSVVGKYVPNAKAEYMDGSNSGVASGPDGGGSTNPNSKGKKLFHVDPQHPIIAISRSATTSEGSVSSQLFEMMVEIHLESMNGDKTTPRGSRGRSRGPKSSPSSSSSSPSYSTRNGPSDSEEFGVKFATQLVKKFSDKTLEKANDASKNYSKSDLLTLGQWLKFILNLENVLFDLSTMDLGAKNWMSKYLWKGMKPEDIRRVSAELESDPMQSFSESKCLQELPKAISQYGQEAPAQYTLKTHMEVLERVVQEFRVCVGNSGQVCETYVAQLREACNSIWKNGRRLCEGTSLTGNPCVREFHEIPAENTMDDHDRETQVEPHSSEILRCGSCNCGKTMSYIADPFDIVEANVSSFEKPCCEQKTVPDGWLQQHSYDINTGLEYTGLVEGFNRLFPTRALASPVSLTPSAKSPAQKKHHHHHRARGNRSSLDHQGQDTQRRERGGEQHSTIASLSSCTILAGLEYECRSGHRFILPPYKPVQRDGKENSDGALSSQSSYIWPEISNPVFTPCVQCKHTSSSDHQDEVVSAQSRRHTSTLRSDEHVPFAQLIHVLVAIPKNGGSVLLQPTIMMNPSTQDEPPRTVFHVDTPVSLKEDMLYTLRLPYVYIQDGKSLCLENSNVKSSLMLQQGVISCQDV